MHRKTTVRSLIFGQRDRGSLIYVEQETEICGICGPCQYIIPRIPRSRAVQGEKELTDVRDMTLAIDHDVTVVTVLDLDDVAE